MRKYQVSVFETHVSLFEVDASCPQEAIRIISNGEIEPFDHSYIETSDHADWGIEEIET